MPISHRQGLGSICAFHKRLDVIIAPRLIKDAKTIREDANARTNIGSDLSVLIENKIFDAESFEDIG